MSEDYELASYSREGGILRIDEMYDGVQIESYKKSHDVGLLFYPTLPSRVILSNF